VASNVS